ncbi:hypothetical protein [Gemmatimonas sp.]|uniref:hypothetical protein n=1 Tax=Gemmatimonas sp. TaxID=1962908 RepID=UPI0025C58C9F|nr:hypothetical protein [Gemmatimonas sp.]MCA2991953.1 hypothetical protein [Gemmatimonas sp.]
MIRADSWATVGAYAVAFGGAVASRLHAYWPRERQRRAQHTTTRGIDEATEVQLTAATDAFRARLSEILARTTFSFT